MMPPVFVISLRRAADRRADISARLQKAGFQYEIADATDGAAESRAAIESKEGIKIDDRLYQLCRGRALSPGEIGCYLSHYKLWQRIAAEKPQCALVLEDDARWENDLPKVARDLLACEQQWGLCLLATDKGKCAFRKLHPVGENRWLGYPLKRTMALAGYFITPHAAENLCATLRNIREPVDIALCRHWEWNDMRLSVRPPVVFHDETNTTIGDRGADGGRKRIWHQIIGGIVNIPEWCRRIFHFCAVRPQKSPR